MSWRTCLTAASAAGSAPAPDRRTSWYERAGCGGARASRALAGLSTATLSRPSSPSSRPDVREPARQDLRRRLAPARRVPAARRPGRRAPGRRLADYALRRPDKAGTSRGYAAPRGARRVLEQPGERPAATPADRGGRGADSGRGRLRGGQQRPHAGLAPPDGWRGHATFRASRSGTCSCSARPGSAACRPGSRPACSSPWSTRAAPDRLVSIQAPGTAHVGHPARRRASSCPRQPRGAAGRPAAPGAAHRADPAAATAGRCSRSC